MKRRDIMSKLNQVLHYEYSLNYIENVMSLRKPQTRSLKILDLILDENPLSKQINAEEYQSNIKNIYRIFKEFERPFQSLTFELATGVGKTRLMGAMITYLYTNKGVRNFFVVAPNLTIYEKLKNDLGNPAYDNEKYVFKGVGCFTAKSPNVWTDDDYQQKQMYLSSTIDSPINIYIFNIAKFNTEGRKMHSLHETLGESFFSYLSNLDDLVVFMDESHHYRADAGFNAINELNPVLGIELSATAKDSEGNLFKNVVYEYTLKEAIKDGYVRTPYALTRRDLHHYSPTEEEMDKIMLTDGLTHHRNIRLSLEEYADRENKKLVKPFVLVVCKNTNHANWVFEYVTSPAFYNGYYKDKTVIIHSSLRGAEKDENISLLLEVEKADNPIEIVIHVNILKEGWDVNNLYTIIPLRTATSRILREQTVGRGLRLPFGQLTGEKLLDSVTLTAHDKFEEIITEAQREDSIFKSDGVIYTEYQKELQQVKVSQLQFFTENTNRDLVLKETGLDYNDENNKKMYDTIENTIETVTRSLRSEIIKGSINKGEIKEAVAEIVIKDPNIRFKENKEAQEIFEGLFAIPEVTNDIIEKTLSKTMFIPRLKTESFGREEYIIRDFDLDLTNMYYVPIALDITIRNILDSTDPDIVIEGTTINLETYKPEKRLIEGIRTISEVDYEKCSKLIIKLVKQFMEYYRKKYNDDEVRNIVWGYYRDIINNFKIQLIQNIAVKYDGIIEIVEDIKTAVIPGVLNYTDKIYNLYEEPPKGQMINTLIYSGSSKSIYNPFKFDSNPERIFAIVCETSPEVLQWLRPHKEQFNITYNRGKKYEPDFVVETKDVYYLVEVKGENQLESPDVVAKKDRAIQYCEIASEYNIAHGNKPFKYLFIPSEQIKINSSFNNLKDRFIEGK